MRTIILLMMLSFQLIGCNALYFYDTEKVSLTLEGRPDSSQPIQGSLGLKQRTAILVPPQEEGEEDKDGTDALSLISSFRFIKEEGSLFNLGPVTIQTALVTGDAAKLDLREAQELSKVLSGGQNLAKTPNEVVIRVLSKKSPAELAVLKELFNEIDCQNPTAEQKAKYQTLLNDEFKEPMCSSFKDNLR